ncbi:MarR family winged helix-turn-helix transcriptional regulator [Amorphus coralli]|uniref:MarR family winged helix-turn-helix transcriptional regulator n=1 Tax=Amorphus coralli TaxID=340680 RepID=UPI000361C286|nr:MarR family transcriptional regulator [Amorphus coralli]
MTIVDTAPATDRPDVELGILEEFLGFYLRLAYESAFDDFSRELGPDSLKPGNFALLSIIFENPGITQTVLARASGRDKSSVTAGLRQLEDKGLIERTRLEDDRRSYASRATPEGCVVYERIAAKARNHMRRLDRIVGAKRKALLMSTLKDIVDGLAEDGETPAGRP